MPYMKTEDVAAILNVSVQSLRSYIRKGYIRCGSVPSGRVYRFSPQQVEAAKACFEEVKHYADAETDSTVVECGTA